MATVNHSGREVQYYSSTVKAPRLRCTRLTHICQSVAALPGRSVIVGESHSYRIIPPSPIYRCTYQGHHTDSPYFIYIQANLIRLEPNDVEKQQLSCIHLVFLDELSLSVVILCPPTVKYKYHRFKQNTIFEPIKVEIFDTI